MPKKYLFAIGAFNRIGIFAGYSVTTMVKEAKDRHGSAHFNFCRFATKNDVEHAKAMGGHVPEGALKS